MGMLFYGIQSLGPHDRGSGPLYLLQESSLRLSLISLSPLDSLKFVVQLNQCLKQGCLGKQRESFGLNCKQHPTAMLGLLQ